MKNILKVIVFSLVLLFPSIVLAANLTKADLEAAAAKWNNLCQSEESYLMTDETTGQCTLKQTVEVTDTAVIVTVVGQQGTLSYDYQIGEDGIITFTTNVPIQTGMTKGQYKAVEDPAAINSIPYILVATARGARIGAAQTYIVDSFGSVEFTEELVANCANLQGEALTNCLGSVGSTTTGTGTQYTEEEFPAHVIEVAEAEFAQPRIIKDNKPEQINSATLTTAFTKVDADRGRFDIKAEVNTNADFSKIEKSKESPETSTEPVQQQPQPKEPNPGTGASVPIIIMVGFLIIGIVLLKQYGKRAIHNI